MILKSDLDDIPDQGLVSLLRDLYRQIRDAKEAIESLYTDIREVLFYIYIHRPNMSLSSVARQLDLNRKTINTLLNKHEGFVRLKGTKKGKEYRGDNKPDFNYTADANLDLIPVGEAITNAVTPGRERQ